MCPAFGCAILPEIGNRCWLNLVYIVIPIFGYWGLRMGAFERNVGLGGKLHLLSGAPPVPRATGMVANDKQ